MKREIHSLIQGSQPWHAFRACHDGASEAAAMMGLSSHTTRTELLRQKSTGIAKDASDFVQAKIFDRGHEVETLARPLAEELIGEEFYPATCSFGRLSASCDGLTMDQKMAWEHKQYNQDLFSAVDRGELPEEYQPQCQHILYVTGAELLLFMCSDGTARNRAYMTVYPDLVWQNRLLSGWEQFNIDLAAYVHVEAAPVAVATPTMSLPALNIQVNGSLTLIDNLSVFGEKLHAFIEGIDKNPSDDQAFADAEAAIKTLEKAEGALQAAEDGALAQTAGIEEMRRTVALYAELARTTRLMLGKLVKARKEAIRVEIVFTGKARFDEHIRALNTRIGKPWMPVVTTDFTGVIKGRKTVASLRDAIDTELARAKIEASAIADRIQLNLSAIERYGSQYPFLFVDSARLVLKDPGDLVALVKTRIAEHKIDEAKRLEAEREKIRVEEAVKIKVAQEWEKDAAEKIQRAQAAAVIVAEDYKIVAQAFAMLDAAREVKHAIVADITRDTIKPPTNAQDWEEPTSEALVESVAAYWGITETLATEWLMAWKPVRDSAPTGSAINEH